MKYGGEILKADMVIYGMVIISIYVMIGFGLLVANLFISSEPNHILIILITFPLVVGMIYLHQRSIGKRRRRY